MPRGSGICCVVSCVCFLVCVVVAVFVGVGGGVGVVVVVVNVGNAINQYCLTGINLSYLRGFRCFVFRFCKMLKQLRQICFEV